MRPGDGCVGGGHCAPKHRVGATSPLRELAKARAFAENRNGHRPRAGGDRIDLSANNSSASRFPMHDTTSRTHWHERKAREKAGKGKFGRPAAPSERSL